MDEKEAKVAPGTLSESDITEEISKMNLPSNSNSGRRMRKVVQGKAVTRKPSLAKKFSDTFIAEDISDVKSYLFFDVLVPAVKDTIVNFVVIETSWNFS